MTREVVIDTETTGYPVHQGHRIVSLGVVELVHGRLTGRDCEWFFDPGRKNDPGAFAVHGLPDHWLEKQLSFKAQRTEIIYWIDEAKLIAHHAPFDRGFLNNELALTCGLSSLTESDLNFYPKEQWIDSLPRARRMFPKQDNKLDALAARYGIDTSHRKKHGALKDARILAEVWIEMLRGGQGDLFAGMAAEMKGAQWTPPVIDYANLPIAPPRLTSAERERWHKMHVEDAGEKAIWHDYL